MKNKYFNFFLLNLITSLMLSILVFEIYTIFGIENIFFLIISAGFILSFFIKEKSLAHYIRVIFLNSQFFGYSFALFSFIFVSDGLSNFSIFGLIIISQTIVVVYFIGASAGIVSKAIIERLMKQEKGNLSGVSLQEKL